MIKADLHLHTYHSDNQDRMTPAEYVALARELGYGALGFCDHHHNLTDEAWTTLRAEVDALQSPDLLLTTGYEATWMAGHLCVLDQETFNAGTYAECMPQTWSPTNLRILAHPDNNICAWLMPLPVGIQGVEVINSGRDPYSMRSNSPCNGLNTFRRYLALDHPVAAIAQSDCHRRITFGRVWTGIVPPRYVEPGSANSSATQENGGVFDRAALHAALVGQHTIAVMGELPVQVWCEGETQAGPGETIDATSGATLHWETPPGTTVQLWLADRPVAEFASSDGVARYTVEHNGPHWLLCRHGLHWAVTSPIWVYGRPGVSEAVRAALGNQRVVQAAAARVEQRVAWLRQVETEQPAGMWPVEAYTAWATRLLPQNWRSGDAAWSGVGDPVDWAMQRLTMMETTLEAVLRDLVRRQAQATAGADGGTVPGSPTAVIATAGDAVPAGTYQFYLEVPPTWTAWRLVDAHGAERTATAVAAAGVRDPLHGPRRREQMFELIPWLRRGEIHEYRLHRVQLTVEEARVSLTADLWPAALEPANGPQATYPAEADWLQALLDDGDVTDFTVHLRMPKRYDVAVLLDASHEAAHYLLQAQPVPPESPAESAAALMGPDALATDPSAHTIICQIR